MKKIKYTVTSTNIFSIAATLVYLRVPFTFIPHREYNDRRRPNEYHQNVVEFTLEENGKTAISHILWAVENKWGETFDFTILKEEEI